MSKKRFSEEQIIYALKQAEGGRPVREVCRELGVSELSFYAWRKNYKGLESASSVSLGSCVRRTGS
jgi:putative transposase